MRMFSFYILCAALVPLPATYTSHWSLVHPALISLVAQIKMAPFNVTTSSFLVASVGSLWSPTTACIHTPYSMLDLTLHFVEFAFQP
jgi:hypothetical protein